MRAVLLPAFLGVLIGLQCVEALVVIPERRQAAGGSGLTKRRGRSEDDNTQDVALEIPFAPVPNIQSRAEPLFTDELTGEAPSAAAASSRSLPFVEEPRPVGGGPLALEQVTAHSLRTAAGFFPLPVDQAAVARFQSKIHNKLVMARAQVQDECSTGLRACKNTKQLLDMLIDTTSDVEPARDLLTEIRLQLGLQFWLYTPGPAWAFVTLDKDRSNGITWQELEHVFKRGDMVRMFAFMDTDQSGDISRQELVDYLSAAVNLRELVPDVDEVDPHASFKKTMANVAHLLEGPPRPRMPYGSKFVLIIAMIAAIFGALYVFCVRPPATTEKEGK